jgi:hypothetical protein
MLKRLRFLFLAATLMSDLGGVAVASTFECKIVNLSGSIYETKYFTTRAEAKAWARIKVGDLNSSSIFSKYSFTVEEINTSSAQPTLEAKRELEAERKLEVGLDSAKTWLRIFKTEADRDPANVNRQRDLSAGYRISAKIRIACFHLF